MKSNEINLEDVGTIIRNERSKPKSFIVIIYNVLRFEFELEVFYKDFSKKQKKISHLSKDSKLKIIFGILYNIVAFNLKIITLQYYAVPRLTMQNEYFLFYL